MKTTGILAVAAVVLAAGSGADTTPTATPAGSGTSVSSTDGSVADAQDTRVRLVVRPQLVAGP